MAGNVWDIFVPMAGEVLRGDYTLLNVGLCVCRVGFATLSDFLFGIRSVVLEAVWFNAGS